MGEASSNALKGKRVVVTRAAEQSEALVRELRERGAVPVVLPMVAFGPPEKPELLDEALRQMREFDWVFFTSQNAVRAVRERGEILKVHLGTVFSGVKIAAVGPATAEAVERAGLHVAYVAAKHQGTALAQELHGQVRGKLVLLPRSDRANPELVENLKLLGAEVVEVCAYKTIRPEKSDLEAGAAMVEGQTDAVLFFSSSAVHHLQDLLGHERFLGLSRRSVFAAIGPVTHEALQKAGVDRALLAQDTSVSAVVEALSDYFALGAQPGVPVPRGAPGSAEAKPQ